MPRKMARKSLEVLNKKRRIPKVTADASKVKEIEKIIEKPVIKEVLKEVI